MQSPQYLKEQFLLTIVKYLILYNLVNSTERTAWGVLGISRFSTQDINLHTEDVCRLTKWLIQMAAVTKKTFISVF